MEDAFRLSGQDIKTLQEHPKISELLALCM